MVREVTQKQEHVKVCHKNSTEVETRPEEMFVFYSNCHSVVNKLDELRELVCENRHAILSLTETWTHQDLCNSELMIPGYELKA